MPLVSIVVPVYNAEKYLMKCLESIKNQTLKDFECILVDDGSTDSSSVICDSFATVDGRFSVVHLKNGGVSRARNEGIKRAKGEYVGFVDSDDWIDPEMFESLYRDARNHNADISICGVYEDFPPTKITEMTSAQAKICMFSNDGFRGYSVNKLAKRELLENVRFDESIICYEDLVFFFQLFSNCSKVVWNGKPLYHYFRHEGTLSTDYKFNEEKKKGINRLKQCMDTETDGTVVAAMRHYFFDYHLETAINYVSRRAIQDEGFHEAVEYVIENQDMIKDCTLRQKIWMKIIFKDSLKRLYWFIKGVK